MKKAFSILLPFLPLIYVLSIAGLFFLDANDELLFAILGCFVLLSLALTVLSCSFAHNVPLLLLTRSNIWAAVSNLTLLICEIVYWVITLREIRVAEADGAMGGGLALVVLFLLYLPHWVSYLLTRICGAVNCMRILRHSPDSSNYMLHIPMQLFPITDMISAILLHIRVKNLEN